MTKGLVAGFVASTTVAGALVLAGHLSAPLSPPVPSPVWDHVHPLPNLTPGVLNPALTFAVLTAPGFTTKTYRNVPQSEKDAVYREYGVLTHKPGEYEVDHLISIELGGSNDIGNLWVQSYQTQPWNAHVKDAEEDYLAAQVRAGKIPLAQAQHDISTDWIAAYQKYFKTALPLAGHGAHQAVE